MGDSLSYLDNLLIRTVNKHLYIGQEIDPEHWVY